MKLLSPGQAGVPPTRCAWRKRPHSSISPTHRPGTSQFVVKGAIESLRERETGLGISALMRDRSQLVSREVQYNARGVADGFIAKVVCCTQVPEG